MGKWRVDELKGVEADFSIAGGNPELKGVMVRTQPRLPLLTLLPLCLEGSFLTAFGKGGSLKVSESSWAGIAWSFGEVSAL